jgi:hypothetical protein
MIDHCSTCVPPNWMPGVKRASGANRARTTTPSTMPNTGPPISGTQRPSSKASRPIASASNRPGMRLRMPGWMTAAMEGAFMRDSGDARIVRVANHQQNLEYLMKYIKWTDD